MSHRVLRNTDPIVRAMIAGTFGLAASLALTTADAASPRPPKRAEDVISDGAGGDRAATPDGRATAAASGDDDEHDADAPERQIPEHTRAPAHPDCEQHVPLWEHVVDKGETLGGIAGRYGVRRGDLVRLNAELANPDLIRPGQRIRVCPNIAPRLRKEIEVTVRPGDTAGGIALAHGLTVAELVGMQRGALSDPNKLTAGRTLRLVVDDGIAPEFLPAEVPKPKAGARRGTPTKGMAHASVSKQLSLEQQHYFVKRPHLAWGTDKTIGAIERAVSQYARRHRNAPQVHIGDISKRGGGALHPHLSHRQGRDVDVGYVLLGVDGERTRFSGVTRSNLDVARTWSLVKSFVDTGNVEVIFMDYGLQQQLYEFAKERGVGDDELDELFQYPRGRGRSHGMIRHWRSHQHHFHVRFRR